MYPYSFVCAYCIPLVKRVILQMLGHIQMNHTLQRVWRFLFIFNIFFYFTNSIGTYSVEYKQHFVDLTDAEVYKNFKKSITEVSNMYKQWFSICIRHSSSNFLKFKILSRLLWVWIWGGGRTHISLHFIIISISLIRKKACLVWVRIGIYFFRLFPPLWILYPHISGLLPVGRVLSTFRIGGTGTDDSALRGWLKGGRV